MVNSPPLPSSKRKANDGPKGTIGAKHSFRSGVTERVVQT